MTDVRTRVFPSNYPERLTPEPQQTSISDTHISGLCANSQLLGCRVPIPTQRPPFCARPRFSSHFFVYSPGQLFSKKSSSLARILARAESAPRGSLNDSEKEGGWFRIGICQCTASVELQQNKCRFVRGLFFFKYPHGSLWISTELQ